jgi:hypothetical protein
MANQVDFKILPSDQFNVYSPQTRSEKIITYFTLLSKLRGDILAVSSQDDPNDIVSAYYSNVGGTQTLHLVKADGSEVTASQPQQIISGTVNYISKFTTSNDIGNSLLYDDGTNVGIGTTSMTHRLQLGTGGVFADYFQLDTTYSNGFVTGALSWDIDNGTMDVGLSGTLKLKVGQDDVWYVKNQTGSTIAKGVAVYANGTLGASGRITVAPMIANGTIPAKYFLGITAEAISNGADGYVLAKGKLRQINTNAYNEGDVLWVSPSSAGALTNTEPTAPNLKLPVAFVVYKANSGILAIRATTGARIEDASDVNYTGALDNSFLIYNSSTGVWEDETVGIFKTIAVSGQSDIVADNYTDTLTVASGTGISLTTNASTDTLTITNSAPDQTVVLTAGTGITVSGTYPSFTITNSSPSSGGTVTSIATTAPITGGTITTTGTIGITQATTSTDGYLSSTDWTTFNSKASDAFKTIAVSGQSNVVADSAADTLTFEAGSNIVITTDAATDKITISAVGGGTGSVTSVDMTVPTGFAISGNPITSSGTLALAFASGYSLPTDASQANWNTAYNDSITAFSYNTSTGVLTLTQQDAGTLTATVTLQPFSTTNLSEGTNLYFTTSRARQSLSAGTGISYDNSTGVITNSAPDQIVSLSAGTGISTSGTYPSFTITNTAPDQTVVLTGAGTTVVTGTYPSFTITSNDQYVGTVTSVATSAPITGGTITSTGTIGITQSGTSSDGYLSSTDWNTFNSKVGGSGTTNYVPKWTSGSAIGNSQIFDNGTNVGIGTAVPTQKLEVNGVIESYYLEFKPVVFYDFNSDTTGDWGKDNSTLSVPNDSVTRYTATGVDSNINKSFNFDGGQNQIIRIRYKVITGTAGSGQIFYANSQHGFSASYFKGFSLVSDGAWHTLVLDMSNLSSGGTDWIDYNVTQIRFDLTDASGVVIDIDWISIGGNGYGTQYFENDVAFMNGNVGIGTTSPNSKLHISTTSSNPFRMVRTGGAATNFGYEFGNGDIGLYDYTNSSYRYYITSGGNVGFGTTAPQSKVDIVGVLRYGNNAASIGALSYGSAGIVTLEGVSTNTSIGIIPSGTGKVGINTIAPDTMLHVVGDIKVTGGYYDSSADIGSAGQFLKSTGTGTNWTTVNVIDGSGTANYVAKWSDSDTITDSIIFDNGTDVGIGTASPGSKLDILSSANPFITVRTASYAAVLGADTTNGYIKIGAGTNHAVGTVVNGTIRTWLDTDGDFGIGTTSPGSRLSVSGSNSSTVPLVDLVTTGTGSWQRGVRLLNSGMAVTNSIMMAVGRSDDSKNMGQFYFYYAGDGSNDNRISMGLHSVDDVFNITALANVGIGTTGPSAKLEVSAGAGTAGFNNGIAIVTGNGSYTAGHGGILQFQNEDVITAAIRGVRESGWGSGMALYTHNTSSGNTFGTTVVERMRITESGNVGINTTAPGAKLEIAGGSANWNETTPGPAVGTIHLNPGVSTDNFGNAITFGASDYVSGTNAQAGIYLRTDGSYGTKMYFATTDEYVSGSKTRMFIGHDGNVGIGTTSPSAPLHVYKSDTYSAIISRADWNTSIPTKLALAKQYGILAFISTDLVETTNDTSYIALNYKSGLSSYSEGLRVYNNGNVGIGETAPSTLVHLNKSNADSLITSTPSIIISNRNSTSGSFIGGGIFNNTYRDISTSSITAGIYFLNKNSVGAGAAAKVSDIIFATGNYSTDWVVPDEKMRLTNSGNLGINNSNPLYKLSVSGAVQGTSYFISEANNSVSGLGPYDWTYIGPADGAASRASAMQIGDISGAKYAIFGGSYGLGFAKHVSTGSWANALSINGTSTTDSTPNVTVYNRLGIGTTGPSMALEVLNSATVNLTTNTYYVSRFIQDKTNYRGVFLGYDTSATIGVIGAESAGPASSLAFYTYNGSSWGERMRITGAGNVGIGTTTPLKKLVVTTANNTNSSTNKSGALAYFGGGNDDPENQNISFPNPSVTDGSISGMHWWSADVMFGRYKSEAFWSIKETHGGSLGNLQRDIIRGYFYDSGGYSYIDKVVFPNGNVGIGTTSPGAILDVKASASSFNNKIATFQDAYTGSALDIKSQYSVGSFAHMGIQAYFPGSSPMVYNNIVINGLGGNVGIGILTPDKILHVSGPIQIDDAFGSDPSTTAGNPRLGIGDVEGEIYLADPAVWLSIYLNGTEYVIPAYDPY